MNELTEIKLEEYRQTLDYVKAKIMDVDLAFWSIKESDDERERDIAMKDMEVEIRELRNVFKESQAKYAELVGQLEHPRRRHW